MVSVILSASVEIVEVSSRRDFFFYFCRILGNEHTSNVHCEASVHIFLGKFDVISQKYLTNLVSDLIVLLFCQIFLSLYNFVPFLFMYSLYKLILS